MVPLKNPDFVNVKITLSETIDLLKKGHDWAEHCHDWGDGTLGQIALWHMERAEERRTQYTRVPGTDVDHKRTRRIQPSHTVFDYP